MADLIGNRVISRTNLLTGKPAIHSASCVFNIKNLQSISAEFEVSKTNEKSTTILKGCKNKARLKIAERLAGHKFLIDRSGRELPISIGSFSPEVIELLSDNGDPELIPSDTNELFTNGDLSGEVRDAIRFKLLLKSILMHSKLLYNNENDPNLLTFRIDTEQCGDGLINALFMNGSEDRDIYVSFTETTNFKLEEVL